MKTFVAGMAALAASTLVPEPARAALVFYGQYAGEDCDGPGGFSACYASNSPVGIFDDDGDGRSPAVFRFEARRGTAVSPLFPTLSGAEFAVDYLAGNVLSFTYSPGADDPAVHFYTVQGDEGYLLFYDDMPITAGSMDLDSYFQESGWTHITFFNTGTAPGVPEPATWALLLLGFGGAGFALRRRRPKDRTLRVAHN